MVEIALVHKHFDTNHLQVVKSQMSTMGAPQIKCIWSDAYEIWFAVEGCHRLRAAKELGLMPTVIDVSEDETTEVEDDGRIITRSVSELLEELQDNASRTQVLGFEDAE